MSSGVEVCSGGIAGAETGVGPGMGTLEAPQLLVERPLPPGLAFPQNCSHRIKYTCFDVSNLFLIFGATSGGLYVFNRDSCEFIQLIPNKEGAITKITISPDEKCLAFSTHKGIVCVCDCGTNVGTYMKSSILQMSKEHQGNEVTFMIWNENGSELYIGDDVGTVSVLHVSKSITKNVFQTPVFSLMHLDSRIVQLDIKENLLLVSTLTRCFICDTSKEHYAQIGQKLRDGEYGACFFYEINCSESPDCNMHLNDQNCNRVDKTFNILDGEQLNYLETLEHLKIFCARPGSRFWEVRTDGTVICTHQFKQLLAVPPINIISANHFENDNFDVVSNNDKVQDIQILSFSKVQMLRNRYLVTFTKEGIYIFDPKKPALVLWTDQYNDILDCKIINDLIYLWRTSGNITLLSFCTVENFLLKCYTNLKYKLCAQVCALYATLLLEFIPNFNKLHLISGLGEKLLENNEVELYDKINIVLEEIGKLKKSNGQKLKSGIVVVENSFLAKAASADDGDGNPFISISSLDMPNKSNNDEESSLFQKHPEAMKVIKDISITFSDKLNVGTLKLMQKWNNLEDKMKKIGSDKKYCEPLNVKSDDDLEMAPVDNIDLIEENLDIVYNRNQNDTVETKSINTETKENLTVKSIYQHIKLSDINKLDCSDTIYRILTRVACDICSVYQIIKNVEEYMISMGDSLDYSKHCCGKLLLQYVCKTSNLSDTIDSVIADEVVCSYFLQAFINLNSCSKFMTSCDCGFPLPTRYSSQTPEFTDVLNIFIEKRWSSSQNEECYDICKKVPYMWRKILLLRKSEDLVNLLYLILQILDEELLYMYLPRFTVDTWKIAVKLLGTLKKQECLNCGKRFEFPVEGGFRSKAMLNWDSIARLMLKTVGSVNATNILKTYSDFIPTNELSLKFYHSCLFIKLFEKYDGTINNKIIDTIYDSYNFEEAVLEMCNHLKCCLNGNLSHTALPLSVASKSQHWGLKIRYKYIETSSEDLSGPHQPDLLQNLIDLDLSANTIRNWKHYRVGMDLEQTLEYVNEICPNRECFHCCLPLTSRVLIADGGLWVFACGHTFHGTCLSVLQIKLCPICFKGR
ncbi:WD40 repeat domain-containing protein pink [Arctopsyche grandis]|uniref:WD40 repeat domain-containing protein pink n=1 Tax=Arctopsyche grandis TaxID=121162 RepID=UPI00406D85C8